MSDCKNGIDEQCEDVYLNNPGLGYCEFGYDSLDERQTIINYPYLSLMNCSKNCRQGYFLCSKFKFCIDIKLVCDGLNHCFHNEDEMNCG